MLHSIEGEQDGPSFKRTNHRLCCVCGVDGISRCAQQGNFFRAPLFHAAVVVKVSLISRDKKPNTNQLEINRSFSVYISWETVGSGLRHPQFRMVDVLFSLSPSPASLVLTASAPPYFLSFTLSCTPLWLVSSLPSSRLSPQGGEVS